MGSIHRKPPRSTITGIPYPGVAEVNPRLSKLAQRDDGESLLSVLRAARNAGMDIVIGGSKSPLLTPPKPDVPFSVLWFDKDLPEWGSIGVGFVGVSYEADGKAPIDVLTEERWFQSESDEIHDPHTVDELMRWSKGKGWMNDHVIYLAEGNSYHFLINWGVTGYRPRRRSQIDAGPEVIV